MLVIAMSALVPRESASLNVNLFNVLQLAHRNARIERLKIRARVIREDWLPTAESAESSGVIGAVQRYLDELESVEREMEAGRL
jgi:hypothetical protein